MPAVALPQQYTGTIVRQEAISPKVRWMQLTADRPIPFAPGQYASFLIDNNRRPLSFASLPTDKLIDFVVDVSPGGVASKFIANLKPNDEVKMLAPYGRFTLKTTHSRPYLFIATGAGIAPIRAQIKFLLAQEKPRQLSLIFGNHHEEYLLFAEEWQKLAEQQKNFAFIPVLSEPSESWSGERGLVTEVVPRRVANFADYDVYVCGNPQMVKDTLAMLPGNGVPSVYIHTEQFR